jgi:hypothetical protein
MTPEAKQALEKSIEHWERLAANRRLPGEKVGRDHCNLCILYNYSGSDCEGCPVKEKTGREGCMRTPYDKIAHLNMMTPSSYASQEFLEVAKEELLFLKSLLPKEEPEELEINF